MNTATSFRNSDLILFSNKQGVVPEELPMEQLAQPHKYYPQAIKDTDTVLKPDPKAAVVAPDHPC
jgi:hypothetical protein